MLRLLQRRFVVQRALLGRLNFLPSWTKPVFSINFLQAFNYSYLIFCMCLLSNVKGDKHSTYYCHLRVISERLCTSVCFAQKKENPLWILFISLIICSILLLLTSQNSVRARIDFSQYQEQRNGTTMEITWSPFWSN